MRLSWIFTVFILIAIVSLSFCFFNWGRDYTIMAHEIRAKVGEKLEKRHKMVCIGAGGGMMGSVHMISVHFKINHPLDRDEARALIVDCTEELLAAVNANEEIRPFLKDFPFTPKNLSISIISTNPDGSSVFDPYIEAVYVYEENKIHFCTKEPNKIPYKNTYVESYPKALEKVKTRSMIGVR